MTLKRLNIEEVFPVYAGVIQKLRRVRFTLFCVPRVCGGDPDVLAIKPIKEEVFPVYAGVILDRFRHA